MNVIVITFKVIVIDYIVIFLFVTVTVIEQMVSYRNRSRLHLCCNRPVSGCNAPLTKFSCLYCCKYIDQMCRIHAVVDIRI